MGAQYLIHAVPKRRWYVTNFLIPSMVKQGIRRYNIMVHFDDKCEGNLKAFMTAAGKLPDGWGTWHLQDDIIISPDFKKKTEEYNKGIVSGFCSEMYDTELPGKVEPGKLWKGFQCIRIPNYILKDCIRWWEEELQGNFIYEEFWKSGNHDDWTFRQYIKVMDLDEPIINLAPNIVNHVDYLLGGSMICERKENLVSKYWEHDDLIEELKDQIEKFTTNNP